MTRDELVADLARTIARAEGFISPADDGHDVARAVLDRLEALGWTPPPGDVCTPDRHPIRLPLMVTTDHVVTCPCGANRVDVEPPLPLGGPGQGTEAPE